MAPENPIVYFVTGPFAGTSVATCSRLVVGCKSPVTGIYNDSYVGGSFAPEMKFAGYDILVLTGKSAEPVVISSATTLSTLRARAKPKYWESTTSEIEAALRADFDKNAKVMSIGPQASKKLPWVLADRLTSTTRRVAAATAPHGCQGRQGHRRARDRDVRVGNDPRSFLADVERIHREYVLTDDNLWSNEGVHPWLAQIMSDAGVMPTRNWSIGTFEEITSINSDSFQKVKTGNRACFQCAVGCRQWHEAGGVKGEGPEYETIALCGANCGIGDIEALMRFNRECDELGMDTISTGNVLGLAMDMTEKGIHDFGVRFGDVESYLRVPALIAKADGPLAELALGARALAAKYDHPELAMEVKNLELPGYDPRGAFGMSLSYSTSDRGGCHMRSYPVGDEVVTGDLPPDSMEGKAEYNAVKQNFSSLKYTGIWCDFWAIDTNQMAQLFRHVWKRDVSEDELMQVGERIWNLGLLFNLREGVEPDTVPRKLVDEPFMAGPSAGKAIGWDEFSERQREYYRFRGWNETRRAQ